MRKRHEPAIVIHGLAQGTDAEDAVGAGVDEPRPRSGVHAVQGGDLGDRGSRQIQIAVGIGGAFDVEAARHVQQIVEGDLAPRIAGPAPLRQRRLALEVEQALVHAYPHQRDTEALAHRVGARRQVWAHALLIAFSDDLAVFQHHDAPCDAAVSA